VSHRSGGEPDQPIADPDSVSTVSDERPDDTVDTGPSIDEVHDALRVTSEFLTRHGIWHAVGFGTLLGAVRGGDLIPWDHDFDIFARPADRQQIVNLSEELADTGHAIKYAVLPVSPNLAVAPPDLMGFNAAALVVMKDDRPLGDIYTPWLFDDGVLRHFDFANDVWWCARNSMPAWFVEGTTTVTLRGKEYPALRAPERWLAHVYGDDFMTPWRCTQKGGEPREGFTAVGDRAAPSLSDLARWCEAQGWDRSTYAGLPAWPRDVRGLGPPSDLEAFGSVAALVANF